MKEIKDYILQVYKLERLLSLYKKLVVIKDKMIHRAFFDIDFDDLHDIEVKLKNWIMELEK